MLNRTIRGLALLFIFAPFGEVHAVTNPGVGYAAVWESKYVSEGRDNLEEGGIFFLEADLEWEHFATGAWVALGDQPSYEEVNLFAEYFFQVGEFEAYLGYTRLEFTDINANDNELGAGIGYFGIPHLVVGADYTYSTEASGAFVEIFIGTEINLMKGRLVLEPYIIQGLDFGFASEAHDGFNHFQIGLEGHFMLVKNLAILVSVNHSFAQKDVKIDDLGEETWLAVGISGRF
jgi:hypothetical protein